MHNITYHTFPAPRAMGAPDHVHDHAATAMLARENAVLAAITRVNPAIRMVRNLSNVVCS